MLLIPSWRGLLVRNCGGQHQRRPGLSLMGLAAFTILIRSLSLKSTDWPLHLRASDSCGMTRISPASGHVGPVIWHHRVTLANQQPVQGASAAESVCCLHIHLSFSPTGCFFFLYFCLPFFNLSVWSRASISLRQSLLFIWPSWPSALLLLLSRNWRRRVGGRRRRRNGRWCWLWRRRKRD